MLGYSEDELERLSYLDITVDEDRIRNQLLTKELASGARQSLQFEKRYRHKHGEIIWVSVSGNVNPGAPEGSMYFAAIVQDITERKRAASAPMVALRGSECVTNSLFIKTKIRSQMLSMLYYSRPEAAFAQLFEPIEYLGRIRR
jgi:PAS domain S-box-containing protein